MALCRKCPVGPSLSVSQSQVVQEYPLCGLCAPSGCAWATIAASVLVGGVGPRPSVNVLMKGAGPPEWEPFWRCTGAGQGCLLGDVGLELLWRNQLGWVLRKMTRWGAQC